MGLDDYDGCEIPLERMDDFEPEETYIIPNPVLPDTQEDEQGGLGTMIKVKNIGGYRRVKLLFHLTIESILAIDVLTLSIALFVKHLFCCERPALIHTIQMGMRLNTTEQ